MPVPLEPGDVMIEMTGNSVEHSMMWVGGEKSVVHSAEAGDFVGVIQQSPKPYARWKEDDKPWRSKVRIYRNNDGLGPEAAKLAIDWATRSDDQVFVQFKKMEETEQEEHQKLHPRVKRAEGDGKNITIGSPKFEGSSIVLDTPYSQARLGSGDKEWSVLSLFRALRAYHRAKNKLPLSQLKGVTCSQFVTYCYQAAAIGKYFGGLPIPKEILSNISKTDKFYSLKNDVGAADLVQDALKGINVDFIPKGMLVDAKTTSADCLKANLEKGASGFTFIGDMSPSLVVITAMEANGLKTYGDVKKLCNVT